MTLGTKSLLVVSVCAALFGAACKKKGTAGPGSGSDPGSAGSGTAATPVVVDAAAMPVVDAAEAPAPDAAAAAAPAAGTTPELEALEAAIAPILAMKDKDARTKAGCKALDDITAKMRAVDRNPPAGIEPATWTEIVERMDGGFNDFAIECAEGDASDTKALAQAVDTAKELHALLAKKPN